MELFNSWDLSEDDQKKLKNYWERFENYVKPHSNELIAAWELHNFRQGTLSLEEFIAKLIILVKEANYPAEHHGDRFLRDFLVLGMNSEREFSSLSGLEINISKTEAMWLGQWKNNPSRRMPIVLGTFT